MSSVVAVNRGLLVVLCDSGEVVPIRNLLDSDGEETEEVEEAVVFVALMPDGFWVTELFSDFPASALH